MKIIKSLPWAAGLIAILINCGPTRPKIEIGGYDFKYEGKTYRIESIAPNFMEGYNTLILKEDDRIVLKATDKEQDGILDVVDIGELSLEKAKEIYQEGLAQTRIHVHPLFIIFTALLAAGTFTLLYFRFF